jgi:hypothetical protein
MFSALIQCALTQRIAFGRSFCAAHVCRDGYGPPAGASRGQELHWVLEPGVWWWGVQSGVSV